MLKFNKKISKNRGMSYVELIVVLSIFAVVSSIVMFNYGIFQGKVDVKNLAGDIALKIVEAQNSSLNGAFSNHPTNLTSPSSWKPSYGVYFSSSTTTGGNGNGADYKNFLYFTDRNNDGVFNDTACNPSNTNSECLEKISITKNNFISSINKCSGSVCDVNAPNSSLTYFAILFKRPDSAPIFSVPAGYELNNSQYYQIKLDSPKQVSSYIKIYSSGRIKIN